MKLLSIITRLPYWECPTTVGYHESKFIYSYVNKDLYLYNYQKENIWQEEEKREAISDKVSMIQVSIYYG